MIKGGGGEFERHPGKAITGFGLRAGRGVEWIAPAIRAEGARRLAEVPDSVTPAALWSGAVRDPFAEDIVIGTAALALETLGLANPMCRARALWGHTQHGRGGLKGDER